MTQDERISANAEAIKENAEAIRRQTEYLHEIRNYFIPGEEARFRRFAKYVVTPLVKVIALVAFIGGMWDVIAWVMSRYEIKTMADRYARVAEDVYYSENNPEVAAYFLDKAIELRDGDADYRFLRAYMQGMTVTRRLLNLDRPMSKKELDEAHTAYAEARFLQRLRPKRPEPYVLQAQILAALKETSRAEEQLANALEIAPHNAFVHLRLAQVRMDRKDCDGAEAALDEAGRLDPKSKWVWLWKGVLAKDMKNDCEAARNCYEKALEVDPKFDMAWYNLAWTWMHKSSKDYAKARENLQKALALNPDYKEACYAMGMSYGYEDNYPVAKTWMDKAIAIDNAFLSAHKWRGIICGEMAQYDEALRSFGAAILLDPANADLYVRRSKMAVALDRLDDALRDLNFAYELNPSAKRTLLYLGDVYLKAKNQEKALLFFNKAIDVDGKYDDAYARKAALLSQMNKTDEALAAIDLAIEKTSYKPERFWLQKGRILESAGLGADAVECFIKARTIAPRFAAAWRSEALALKALGKAKEAKSAAKAYLDLVPSDEAFLGEFPD